ncbi:MAG TPA: iron-sulfur cluster assembly accessory protein [Pirellulaceae bacterium]|nr:iron-sulfur cluster assembly accessory protein [Hyphomicrobiaceae bacterium]MCC0006564.1 iron-sulfur cluster assembly accessory protein [Hyphomicrobiaceae bacterium]HRX82747.1 iron-sulfur cluster assembly accessory protein [Pirellulaceae bacterium]
MIALTERAATAVKKAIEKSGKSGAGFRVMVENGGCSGLKYKIGLDSQPRQDDEIVESSGIRIFVDPDSLPMLSGVTVDFVEELGKAGFSFDNPNASSKCSCGKSFC